MFHEPLFCIRPPTTRPVPEWSRRPIAEERCFLGDDDRGLKVLQQESYPDCAWELFGLARARLAAAYRLMRQEDSQLDVAFRLEAVERPVLEQAYSRIAAWYRYYPAARKQLRLPLDPRERPEASWRKFFSREAGRIVDHSDSVVWLTVLAVLGREIPEGRIAEAHLADFVADIYGRFSVSRRFMLLGVKPGSARLSYWRALERRLGFGRVRVPPHLF